MVHARLRHTAATVESFFPDAGRNNGLKVLVVDDDRSVCRMFCRQLQDLGYTSFQLVDGVGTLSAVRQQKPDIVILDVFLGAGLDGFDLCKQLKTAKETADIAVIMISGDATKRSDQERARRLGAVALLLKPVSRRELQRALSASTAQADLPAERNAIRGKIVVVDDDPEWLSLTKRWLEDAGHMVVALSHASELIATARRESPDCIVLDFDLADGRADTLCREMRAHPDFNKIQIIGHTAHPDAKVRMLKQGADHFLQKATEPQELLVTVEACLRRTRWDSGVLVAGDLRLDPSRKEVVWKDVLTELSEEQFDFLYALVSRRNQWIAVDTLIAELRRDVTKDALIQLAVRLRKLLQPPLARRVQSDKRMGWIYQDDSTNPIERR